MKRDLLSFILVAFCLGLSSAVLPAAEHRPTDMQATAAPSIDNPQDAWGMKFFYIHVETLPALPTTVYLKYKNAAEDELVVDLKKTCQASPSRRNIFASHMAKRQSTSAIFEVPEEGWKYAVQLTFNATERPVALKNDKQPTWTDVRIYGTEPTCSPLIIEFVMKYTTPPSKVTRYVKRGLATLAFAGGSLAVYPFALSSARILKERATASFDGLRKAWKQELSATVTAQQPAASPPIHSAPQASTIQTTQQNPGEIQPKPESLGAPQQPAPTTSQSRRSPSSIPAPQESNIPQEAEPEEMPQNQPTHTIQPVPAPPEFVQSFCENLNQNFEQHNFITRAQISDINEWAAGTAILVLSWAQFTKEVTSITNHKAAVQNRFIILNDSLNLMDVQRKVESPREMYLTGASAKRFPSTNNNEDGGVCAGPIYLGGIPCGWIDGRKKSTIAADIASETLSPSFEAMLKGLGIIPSEGAHVH